MKTDDSEEDSSNIEEEIQRSKSTEETDLNRDSNLEKNPGVKVLEVFTKQRKRFADVLGTQEITEQLKNKLSQLKNKNINLVDILIKFKDSDVSEEKVNSLIQSLEQTNRELTLCVETLEKENNRLFKKLKAYEEEFEKMQNQIMDIFEFNIHIDGSEEIENLKETIKEKDLKIEELQKQLKDLEGEYMVLYKQIHS
jgi:chaperonin cofactor prefoldin